MGAEDEFEELFELSPSKAALLRQLESGTYRSSTIHSVIWKYLFSVIGNDPEKYVSEILEHRKVYENLRRIVISDPKEVKKATVAGESDQHETNESILETIYLDLERTMPGDDFFEDPQVLSMMSRILLINTVLNYKVGYRQGMHELLAPIILLHYREYKNRPEGITNKTLKNLLDPKFIEHDSFWIFHGLMEWMKDYYYDDGNGLSISNDELVEYLRGTRSKLVLIRNLREKFSAPPEVGDETRAAEVRESRLNFVTETCQRIQNEILAKKDRRLARFLANLGIEPQVYMLKWLRLLFFREFHIEDVIHLWECLFIPGYRRGKEEFQMGVAYFSVAMLIYIRNSVMVNDINISMKRLFKFPPIEDVSVIIEIWNKCRDPDWTVAQLLGNKGRHGKKKQEGRVYIKINMKKFQRDMTNTFRKLMEQSGLDSLTENMKEMYGKKEDPAATATKIRKSIEKVSGEIKTVYHYNILLGQEIDSAIGLLLKEIKTNQALDRESRRGITDLVTFLFRASAVLKRDRSVEFLFERGDLDWRRILHGGLNNFSVSEARGRESENPSETAKSPGKEGKAPAKNIFSTSSDTD